MPAVSKKQQQFFGMVHAGVIAKPEGMKDKDVKKFAKTKHKGLPVRKTKTDENMTTLTFKQFLTEMHGPEALQSDERFLALSPADQRLVLFKVRKDPEMWEDILSQYSDDGGMYMSDEGEPAFGDTDMEDNEEHPEVGSTEWLRQDLGNRRKVRKERPPYPDVGPRDYEKEPPGNDFAEDNEQGAKRTHFASFPSISSSVQGLRR